MAKIAVGLLGSASSSCAARCPPRSRSRPRAHIPGRSAGRQPAAPNGSRPAGRSLAHQVRWPVITPICGVAEADQMLGGLAAARPVGGGHHRHILVERHAGIDDHERRAEPLELAQLGHRLQGDHQQRAIGRAMHQVIEHRDLTVLPVMGGAEHQPRIALVDGLAGALDDRGEVGVLGEGHHQPHQAGTLAGQGAGVAIAGVAQVAHMAQHQFARGGRHIGPTVEHAGDGGDRDAGTRGDIAYRRARHAAVARTASSFIGTASLLLSGNAYNYTTGPRRRQSRQARGRMHARAIVRSPSADPKARIAALARQ